MFCLNICFFSSWSSPLGVLRRSGLGADRSRDRGRGRDSRPPDDEHRRQRREEKARSDLGEKADESAETSRELLHCCCWAGRVSPCCCSLITCHLSPAPQRTTLHGESPPSRLPTMTSNVACHFPRLLLAGASCREILLAEALAM